jgi:hypothetical protein
VKIKLTFTALWVVQRNTVLHSCSNGMMMVSGETGPERALFGRFLARLGFAVAMIFVTGAGKAKTAGFSGSQLIMHGLFRCKWLVAIVIM